jgi:hypothetical protein
MFFKNKRIEQLEASLMFLDAQIDGLRNRINKLEEARWGFKVDGTPKAKPGKKVKNERIS